MRLIDFLDKIENIDEELIIFQEHINDKDSEIILSYAEEGDQGIKIIEGKKYYYLIEVFIAKEFLQGWLQNLDSLPSKNEIAKRLYEYSINDA
jgi:hypothetical protein